MAKRLQFCAALLLSMLFVTGCTVDVEDPAAAEGDSGAPSTSPNTAPVIQLIGDEVISLSVNSAFIDPGVVATDAEDGDLTDAVSTSNVQVDTSRPGQYEITYRVTDSGNLASQPVKRIVIISEIEAPAAQPEQPQTLVPAITSVKLVGFTESRELVELSAIENGSTIDLSQTSIDLLNVVADSADATKTGSVHFKLSGPISIDRWENNAIYTMVVDTVNLSVSKSQLPVGDYTLVITPYSLPDMAGNKGAVKTVNFKVVDKQTASNVPKIAAVDLVSVTDGTGAYVAVTRISEGAEVNLSDINTKLINVIALSEDASKTGSVHFSLSGPVDIDRSENNVAYAMADETQHIDVSKNELPAGDYTLVVTPYAGIDAKGEAGIPLLVNFSVVGKASTPSAPVVVAPAIPDPVAVADTYTFQVGSDAQPGETQPVSVNDQFESGAVYAITKAPSNGSARMFDLGFFTYTPNSGFSGTDSFTYQITQAGKTSSASVTLNVVAPVTNTSSGFTVVKPSSDSKLIYVSSSTGKDSNSCLSEAEPCKSIAAGLEKMRNGYPDHLYLKRGDTWRNEQFVNLHSGRSASEPAVITYYGKTGDRPRLENSSRSIHIFKTATKHFSFIGLEFYAYKMDPKHPEFDGNSHADVVMLGGNQNILFEDNKFNLIEMVLQEWDSGNPANITLRRNIWTGAYYNRSAYDVGIRPSNLYADSVDGLLIEENVFDHGGWNSEVAGAAANMYNHNLYIQYSTVGNKLVVRRNIITRASSHGVHGRPGGLFENNFFARNAISLQMGYNGHPLAAGTKAQAIDNVITEGHSMVKGNEACAVTSLCTSALWGLVINEPGKGEFLLRNNIVHTLSATDTQWSGKYNKLSKTSISALTGSQFKYENNISWAWTSATEGTDKTYSSAGRTLADYNQSLTGKKDFDGFMDVVKSRPVGTWDERYSADAINNFIRSGFGR